MNELTPQKTWLVLPFKSVAVALLFSATLGPIGLLYSSFGGGCIMILLGVVAVRAQLLVPIVFVWILSCIWGVAAANRYNQKILRNYNEKNNQTTYTNHHNAKT